MHVVSLSIGEPILWRLTLDSGGIELRGDTSFHFETQHSTSISYVAKDHGRKPCPLMSVISPHGLMSRCSVWESNVKLVKFRNVATVKVLIVIWRYFSKEKHMHRYITVKFKDKVSHYCERYTLGKLLGSGSVPSPTAVQKLLKYMDIYAFLYVKRP